jgi:hypothetical protein
LLYGDSGREIEFDDRVLAHLQIVISTKLRRRECFFFSWKDDAAAGNGRTSVWLASSIPLLFKFSTATRHIINREWIDQLTVSANSAQGLYLSDEVGLATPAPPSRV